MPRAITHYLFASDCLNNLDIQTQNIIKKNINVYNLGSQGPNFFNYYNDLSFMNKKSTSELSALIHNKDTDIFFKNMVMYCNSKNNLDHLFNNTNFKNICISYIYGFLSHYILDEHSHPYIYSLQKTLKEKYKYKSVIALHKSIETHIDKLILFKFKNLKPYNFKDYLNIDINNEDLLVICDMYSYLLSYVYNKKITCEDIKKSYYTFKKVEKKLNTSSNLFSKIYLNIKNTTVKNSFIDNEIYSNYSHCVNDLLNENHSVWIDPITLKKYTYSFLDIYNNSLDIFLHTSRKLDSYFKGKSSIDF